MFVWWFVFLFFFVNRKLWLLFLILHKSVCVCVCVRVRVFTAATSLVTSDTLLISTQKHMPSGLTEGHPRALLMSTHNLCCNGKIRKFNIFGWKKHFIYSYSSPINTYMVCLISESELFAILSALYRTSSSYCKTLMARTALGPWKFIRDMGSSSHWGLIMAPGQEANVDNSGKYSINNGMLSVLIRIASMRQF